MTGCRHLTVAAVVLLAPVGVAHAGTARVTVSFPGDGRLDRIEQLEYVAAPGEANRVTIAGSAKAVVVIDRAGIEPARGCRRVGRGSTRVRCVATDRDIDHRVVSVGDGADHVRVKAGFAVVMGGEGDDEIRARGRLKGGGGDDVMNGRGSFEGGPGDDVMTSGAAKAGRLGPDVFVEGDPSNGSDTIKGGPGGGAARSAGRASEGDQVSYSGRTGDLQVDLEGDRDDGEAGENDRVAGVESIIGGAGDDVLTGDAGRNLLAGEIGTDVLVGARGDDELAADSLAGGVTSTPDRLDGGPGADRLTGSGGFNDLRPGAGADIVLGGDGADTIAARDRSPEQVACEGGDDRVEADRRDLVHADCELVRREGEGSAVPLEALVYGPPRVATVRVGCPADGPPRCVGTISILHRGRLAGRRCFTVERGRNELVWFRGHRRLPRLNGRPVQLVARSRDSAGRIRAVALGALVGDNRAVYPDEGEGTIGCRRGVER